MLPNAQYNEMLDGDIDIHYLKYDNVVIDSYFMLAVRKIQYVSKPLSSIYCTLCTDNNNSIVVALLNNVSTGSFTHTQYRPWKNHF